MSASRNRRREHLDALAHGWRQRVPREQVGPMRVAFRLPWGLSVNHYFLERVARNSAGKLIVMKHPSRDAIAWRERVGIEVMRQAVPRHQLTGRMAISIMACPPNNAPRDLDNLLKGCFDALVWCGIVEDDGQFDDVRIWRGPVVTDGMMHVEIMELPGGAMTSEPLPMFWPAHADLREAFA
jgi:crossover junction endodeoxyribonuclease RusA